MSASFALLLLLLGQGSQASETGPMRCTLDGGSLVVAGLPPWLDDEEVSRHLGSGLTVTLELVLEARAAGARARVDWRFEVRYEPWDEVYLLYDESEPRDGQASGLTVEGLKTWWQELELAVDLPGGSGGRRWRATVEAGVVPFSAAEREDARRWLARSGRGAAESSDGAPSEGRGQVGSLLELVMATGIDQRAVLGNTWRLDCPGP